MGRALRLLLVRKPANRLERFADGERRDGRHLVRIVVVLARLCLRLERQLHNSQEALEVDVRRARGEKIAVRHHALHRDERNCADSRTRIGHLARDEAPPHEVVQLLLRCVQLHVLRHCLDVRRAYRLVSALRPGLGLVVVGGRRKELRAVPALDEGLRSLHRLRGDVHRVRSHVRYEALLVKRLRELHGPPRREPEHA